MAWLPPVIVTLVIVGPTEPENLALPAAIEVPTVKLSAATVPVKLASSGAALAVESFTLMVLLSPLSTIVPAMVTAEALLTAKVEEPLRVMFEAMVTSPLTVAVFEAAMVRLSAVNAALKVALLLSMISASEVVPTMPAMVALPDPRVKVRSRLVPIASLSMVEEKVTLLLVVVRVLSPPESVTAPV